MQTLRLIPIAALLAACASAPDPAPQATTAPQQPAARTQTTAVVDPVGSYEFTTVVDGQTVTGTMHIQGTPGNYKGRILTNVFPEIPIVGASVETNVINVRANMPEGELTLRMVMDGMNFNGNWALGADSGDFSGKKLAR